MSYSFNDIIDTPTSHYMISMEVSHQQFIGNAVVNRCPHYVQSSLYDFQDRYLLLDEVIITTKAACDISSGMLVGLKPSVLSREVI